MLFSSSLGIFKYLFFFYHTDNARPRHPPAASRHFARICVSGLILGPEVPICAILDNHHHSPHHRPSVARLTHLYDPLNRRGSPPYPSKFLQQCHAASLTLSENSVALLVALVIVLYCSSSNHQHSVRSLVAENPKSILSTDIDLDPLDES